MTVYKMLLRTVQSEVLLIRSWTKYMDSVFLVTELYAQTACIS
jgi:hypothetical protein